MSALAQLSVFPIDKGESLSTYVAGAVKIIKESGLDYQLGPMGTTIEGELSQVMEVTRQCIEETAKDSDRVYMVCTVDYRTHGQKRMQGKVDSINKKIGS